MTLAQLIADWRARAAEIKEPPADCIETGYGQGIDEGYAQGLEQAADELDRWRRQERRFCLWCFLPDWVTIRASRYFPGAYTCRRWAWRRFG